jgi:hypothetical protein
MNTPKTLSELSDKPKVFSKSNEIFTDLDIDIDTMYALTIIFEYIWQFKWYEESNTIVGNIKKQDEWEQHFNWISFNFIKA